MVFQFAPQNAKDLKAPWVHTFMYGPSGVGKTRASSTWPNPLFLVPSNEASIVTLLGQDIKYIEVSGRKDIEDVVGHLENVQSQHGEDYLPCETLVIESLSHFNNLVVEEITAQNRGMDQRGWGMVAGYWRQVQARLRRLSMYVNFTSLAQENTNDQGAVTGGGPLITGQTKVMLPSACDIITYLELREGKPPVYTAHFQTFKGFTARSRFTDPVTLQQLIPPKIENLTYNKICGAFGGQPVEAPQATPAPVVQTQNN